MAKPCAKCGRSPKIKINILNYCKDCFLCNFEAKVFRNITRVTPESRIFVFLEDSCSSIAIQLLLKYFGNRHVSRIEVFCKNTDVIPENSMFSVSNRTFDGEAHAFENLQGSSGLEFCTKYQFDIFMYAESLEGVVCRSMELLCAGMGQKAVENCGFEDTSTINLFGQIKDKEIAYYAYLKGMARVKRGDENNKIRSTLRGFLSEIDSKNGLALFNILSTFKKLG